MIKKAKFQFQHVQGESCQAGNTTVTPFTRRFTFGLPEWITAKKGLIFIFQQPSRLKVERDGRVIDVPVRDYEGIIVISLLVITAVIMIITKFMGNKEKEYD
jgi:hypothetical protein